MAEVYESGSIREEGMLGTVQDELDCDPGRSGVAVLVKVHKIEELNGNALQER